MTQSHSYTPMTPKRKRQLDLFGPVEVSDEDWFWILAEKLKDCGITRSQAGMLAKVNKGDFAAGIRQLQCAATARHPPSYLGKIISNLRNAVTPVIPRNEPDFVQQWRADGFEIIRRADGTYKIAGDIYDQEGRLIGF